MSEQKEKAIQRLKDIRDRLLREGIRDKFSTEKHSKNTYNDGVIDFYNATLKECEGPSP